MSRFDLVVDLDDERIAWKPLHEALEELDAAGFFPHRFHEVPERELARVDHELGSTFGAEMLGGGAWIIERQTGEALPPLAGCAGYRGDGEIGIAGPFSLDGDLAAHRLTILLGTLFSLRERGYRKALIPQVKAAAIAQVAPLLGGAVLSQTECASRKRARVVVCASGSGSNFQALIDAVADGRLPFDMVGLVANKASAYALERANQTGIASSALVWNRANEDRASYDERVLATVQAAQPDLVLLLGWMHLLPPTFVSAFTELLNIHPAFLPLQPSRDQVVLPDGTAQIAFRGAHAVDDALTAGAQWIGASFHRVTNETDRGGILARVPLQRKPEETRSELEARLHTLEHRIIVEALIRWECVKTHF